jgi:hypothetical protein
MLPAPHKEITTFTPNPIGALIAAAAVPGHVVAHGRQTVGIMCDGVADMLKTFYEAGVRRVQAVIDVAGQRLAVDAAIYRKVDKRNGRTTYWLYPLGSAQTFLRDLLQKHRASAPQKAKRPLPAAILAVVPKPK